MRHSLLSLTLVAAVAPLLRAQTPAQPQLTTPQQIVAAADSAGIAPAALKDTQTPQRDLTCFILSREECVRIALETNPTIRVADMEVRRTDYSKRETLASLFPSIDFSGSYQRSIELQTMRMNMGGQSQSIKMGSDNAWNLGFTAAMPLVNASLWKAIQISDTQILQSLESARASRLDLVNQVNQAYYALLLAKASLEVVRQNYDIALFNADLYKKQFDAGTASEYDVLRTSVQVKNIEPEMLQADIAVKQCKLQLKVLMGMDLDVDVEPSVTLREMQRDMYAYAMTAAESSLADNTQLRSLDISRKLAEQNVTLKKFAYIPTLSTQFNYAWMALSNGNALRNQDFNPYSNVALALNVPIFSGGSRYYGVKGARLQVNELTLQREYLESSLKMQVDLALDNINREARQIASSEESVRQAAKALEIMQKSFEIGAASYLSLRDAELADTSAKLAYYQAIYNYLVSTSELDLLLGRETELPAQKK